MGANPAPPPYASAPLLVRRREGSAEASWAPRGGTGGIPLALAGAGGSELPSFSAAHCARVSVLERPRVARDDCEAAD